ncbi:phospholipase D-like domain-containing protein [Thiotrichales bacterium 19S3-7]|nr:phospholipase D-like domain-containing protein [Thiotrichales bacterium 19S3-7]MCF6801195.1 phospholipase D-like domain-containing protein [Thiotrichales bacterium 19S3-11]
MGFWNIYLLVCHILSLVAFIRVISQKQRTPTSIIAWTLALAFMPYLSVPLYFIIGIRKRPTPTQSSLNQDEIKAQSENFIPALFKSYGLDTATSGNDFKLFTDGVEAYYAFLDELKTAKKRIYISTYVFQDDSMTKSLLHILKIKVKEGVEVKILADGVGSWKLYFNYFLRKKLKSFGIDLRFFMPIFKNPFNNAINLRNHRKIYIIDSHCAFTGGMNLGNEYMGPKPNKKRWQDILFSLQGNSVKTLECLFIDDWHYTTGELLKSLNPELSKGEYLVEVAPSGPDVQKDVVYNVLMSEIYQAKKRIWIMTPYFIPPRELVRALVIANYRGVDVKLITPSKSNHVLADIGRSHYLERLKDANIDVCLFEGEMVHAKAVLFDDTVMLGSVNLDYRSLFLNYELGVFFHSDVILNQIKVWMEGFILNARHEIKTVGPIKQFFANLMKVFMPLL